MKKFSKITGEKINSAPSVEKKSDKGDIVKYKIMELMNQYLSVRTYGPIGRFQVAGTYKIVGQDLFLEALISLMNDKSLTDQNKLLESLKSESGDWNLIDNKISENLIKLNANKLNEKILYQKNSLLNFYEKYKTDEDLFLMMIEESCKKIKSISILEKKYESALVLSNENQSLSDLFLSVAEKFKNRINQLVENP